MSIVTNNIKSLRLYLYKMPEVWRYWIYNNRLTFETFIFFESYWDYLITSKINLTKLQTLTLINNYNDYYNVYIHVFNNLHKIFSMFESILFYKYFILKKVGKEKSINKISSEEYKNIYKICLNILKNILFFLWWFEYNILKNKNKLTKLYIIEDINLEFGYHIYLKDKNNYNPYDSFEPNNLITRENYFKIVDKNHDRYYYAIYERVYVLSSLVGLNENCYWLYYKSKDNKIIKNLDVLYRSIIKKVELNYVCENDLSLLDKEISKEYFVELNLIMKDLYKEWENTGLYNIIDDTVWDYNNIK